MATKFKGFAIDAVIGNTNNFNLDALISRMVEVASFGSEMLGDTGAELDDGSWIDNLSPVVNEQSSEQAYVGTYSRKFTVDGSQNEGIQQTGLSSIANVIYRYSFWVYSSETIVRVVIRNGDNSANIYGVNHTITANEWNYITADVRETVTGNDARFKIQSTAGPTGPWYIDAASRKAYYPTQLDAQINEAKISLFFIDSILVNIEQLLFDAKLNKSDVKAALLDSQLYDIKSISFLLDSILVGGIRSIAMDAVLDALSGSDYTESTVTFNHNLTVGFNSG